MSDAMYLAIALGFAAANWGLVVLCDRLMGGGR
jgi:hypothetical protein